jgi:transcriptional regulator with XRE-family HTH domain
MKWMNQPTFATLLRQSRVAAHLSQEKLAERAGLSVDTISALERGVRKTPHMATVRLLAKALRLNAAERAMFGAAARMPPERDQPEVPLQRAWPAISRSP